MAKRMTTILMLFALIVTGASAIASPARPIWRDGSPWTTERVYVTIGDQTIEAVEEMLQWVVRRVADIRLGVDQEPWLTARRQDVAGVQVGSEEHLRPGIRWKRPEEGETLALQARLQARVRSGRLALVCPLVAHLLQGPERVRL